jgi:hypothetical protein
MFFFHVSWCTEALCEKVVQLLVHGMLACAWSRTRINSCGPNLMVQGCVRTNQTFWTEDEFTVTTSPGIRNRDVRVAKIVARELEKAKPDKWGCVQAREIWTP